MRLYALFTFVLICVASISSTAYAACSSPAGVAGEMGYNITGAETYQYCNNTNWVDMYTAGNNSTKSLISVDFQHGCAIATNDRAYCWGVNWNEGRGGNGTTNFSYDSPILVINGSSSGTWKEISTGGDFTCAIATNDKVYCWGSGANGRLGNGGTSNSTVPSTTLNGASPGTYHQVSGGNDFACGLSTNDKAYCWGRGAEGSIGNGSTADRTSPTLVSNGAGPGTYVQISAGFQHACGLTFSNELYCWGRGFEGQIGDGSTSNRSTPVLVSKGESAGSFKYVYASRFTTCAIGINEKAYCWGQGTYGKLGNNSSANRTTPVLVHNGESPTGAFKKISGGSDQTCALGTDNKAYCWGRALNGRLGNGTTSPNQDEPVLVHNGANPSGTYTGIETGFETTCATGTDSKAYCWGKAQFGRLGNSTASPDQNEPVRVSNGNNTGGNWEIGFTGSTTACTVQGRIDYNSTAHTYQWCGKDSLLQDVTQSPGSGGGSCAASGSKIAGSEGAMQYDTTNNKMVFCGGGSWINIPD